MTVGIHPDGKQARTQHVAVAVVQGADGAFLLARRPEGKPYAGYWEFPGGKVEPGESPADALGRELAEELGIRAVCSYPWITHNFSYPHANVCLHFFRVTAWEGDPHPREGQMLAWSRAGQVSVSPLLPANGPILRALALPPTYGITNAGEAGAERFLGRLSGALDEGLRLVQVREKDMAPDHFAKFAKTVAEMVHRAGGRVLVNGPREVALAAGADGVHLTGEMLSRLDGRPDVELCGASCHNREELSRAVEMGLDYVLLAPVQATLSHPGAPVLGWDGFAGLIQDCPLPVYALGGMGKADLVTAWRHGAHGIAMMRSVWTSPDMAS